MIFFFFSSLVFSDTAPFDFDTHPAIEALGANFPAERAILKDMFRDGSNELLVACLDAIAGQSRHVFTKWQELNRKHEVCRGLIFSQGYQQSSRYEFFYSLCRLSVYPAANSFFQKFENFYQQIQNKPLSASFLMISAILTTDPVQTLTTFEAIIADIPDEEKESIIIFGLFHTGCLRRFATADPIMRFMGSTDEEQDEEEVDEDQQAVRVRIEVGLASYLNTLAAANAAQSDRAE